MAYCNELRFGILSSCHYLNIETMNIISSNTEINRNEPVANITNKLSIFQKKYFYHIFTMC